MAPHFTIAPEDRSLTSTAGIPGPGIGGLDAKWAYISFDYGAKGYRLDLTGNSSTTTTAPIQSDLGTSKPFALDYNSEFLDWSVNPGHISFWNWLSGALGLLLVGLITALIVRQHKANKALLCQVSSSSIPLRHRSGENEATNAVGVTQTQHGEDASDELPVYTLRVSSPPLTKVVTTATTAVASTHPPPSSSSSSLSSSSQLPEPQDQPPVYTSDSATDRR